MTSSPLRTMPEANVPREAAEIQIRPEDVLDRKSQVFKVPIGADIDRFQKVHQRRAVVPGHVFALRDDVVAFQSRDRDEMHVRQVEPRGERLIVAADFSKVSCE